MRSPDRAQYRQIQGPERQRKRTDRRRLQNDNVREILLWENADADISGFPATCKRKNVAVL